MVAGAALAGLGALQDGNSFSPASVKRSLLASATGGALWDVRGSGGGVWPVTTSGNTMSLSLPGSPNLLLYSSSDDGGDEFSSTEEEINARALSSVAEGTDSRRRPSPVTSDGGGGATGAGGGGMAAATILRVGESGVDGQQTASTSLTAPSSSMLLVSWCPPLMRFFWMCP
jgi:hypothetical protein